ncbi:hypothetical protein M427DRAFT_51971 [Gonapodya prolifera JEL478]|uniref:Pyridoxamine 5'-phosphate oxidase N-terminal domain-containing protein n=1 Tax=Gonapodya prolifera (strain JEL478) TaxID=1344416 RepID=A0A139AWC4_GONPJ|nr:hypothetical protein M427DRAFT_51971 [Gonapodya prolifera JEL478]|eukprot:KXS21036.1 hypothetical protein M427DRAFT_51971 [Gonapodya prolifera JEL478]
MGKKFPEITDGIQDFISKQHIFFVASAPLAAQGHLNVSPRSAESFRIVNRNRAYWVDLTGSGAETIAHVKENSRLVVMFCGFEKQPNIVRLWGNGWVAEKGTKAFDDIVEPALRDLPGARAAIVIDITQTGSSCGYSVPFYNYVAQRSTLNDFTLKYEASHPEEGMVAYRREKNRFSWDGLIAIEQGMPRDWEYWSHKIVAGYRRWEKGIWGIGGGLFVGLMLAGGKRRF